MHNIVSETTVAITTVLKDKVFPKLSADFFTSVATGFENRWNFPNCIGAIDGKHINIQVSKRKKVHTKYLSINVILHSRRHQNPDLSFLTTRRRRRLSLWQYVTTTTSSYIATLELQGAKATAVFFGTVSWEKHFMLKLFRNNY